jgi:hypothetical protein
MSALPRGTIEFGDRIAEKVKPSLAAEDSLCVNCAPERLNNCREEGMCSSFLRSYRLETSRLPTWSTELSFAKKVFFAIVG